MRRRALTDVAASVRARLFDCSLKTGEDFQFVLQRFASERFLYRLGQSAHRKQFVLKGAMLYALWGGPIYRPTRDLDFTGYGSTEIEDVLREIKEVCATPASEDGLAFDAASFAAEPIRDSSEYRGLRIKFRAYVGNARIPMQIDVGFGDAIQPSAVEALFPTLLEMPAPRIHVYPREAVVAEKLHAAVTLGERTSRYKDFYDLFVLAQQFAFDGVALSRAVAATFKRRRAELGGDLPTALTPRFYADATRATQWKAYLNRSRLPGPPLDFAAVGEVVQAFVGPVWRTLSVGQPFTGTWSAEGNWQEK